MRVKKSRKREGSERREKGREKGGRKREGETEEVKEREKKGRRDRKRDEYNVHVHVCECLISCTGRVLMLHITS